MISIIDYGLGNIQAFKNIYDRLNIPCTFASSPEDIKSATKLILPGVGSFDWAMSRLNESGLIESINDEVINNKKPILGVCVGMQIMASSSDEGNKNGLGWIPTSIRKLSLKSNANLILPHMGWNNVTPINNNDLFRDIKDLNFYFLHSFFIDLDNSDKKIAESIYGQKFCCAFNYQNIYGTQFHPEKSHDSGRKLLENFANL